MTNCFCPKLIFLILQDIPLYLLPVFSYLSLEIHAFDKTKLLFYSFPTPINCLHQILLSHIGSAHHQLPDSAKMNPHIFYSVILLPS